MIFLLPDSIGRILERCGVFLQVFPFSKTVKYRSCPDSLVDEGKQVRLQSRERLDSHDCLFL
jgi:hypothetical protein